LPNRGYHPLTPGPKPKEFMDILKSITSIALAFLEMPRAIEGIHF